MSHAPKLGRPATRADLDSLPPGWRGEIIDGVLYSFTRPRPPHANTEDMVTDDLKGPFQRGHGGPGGWWILSEPGIELPRAPELSPDLAGWRKERLPMLPRDKPIALVPDWLCEVLSPSTRSYDQIVKRRFYAEIGVNHIWYIDPLQRLLEVSRLIDGKWLQLGLYGADEKVRAEPFEAIEINLAEWWEGIEEGEEEKSRDA
ncbi:MAG: Uma2 family endonuclease [Byssovorax sp.]